MFQGTENDASELGGGVIQLGWAFPVPGISVLVFFGLIKTLNQIKWPKEELPEIKIGEMLCASKGCP